MDKNRNWFGVDANNESSSRSQENSKKNMQE